MAATKEQRIAVLGTLLFLIGFGGILLLFSFTLPDQKPVEQGILINFGDSDDGMGQIEPKPMETNTQEQQQTETVQPVQTAQQTENGEEEEVNDQDFEEAAAIAAKKKADDKKRLEEELEQKKQLELEQQRQAEIEKQQQIAAEQRKRQEQEDAIKNKAANAFKGANVNGGNTGEGETGKEGNQGKLNGDVNTKNRAGDGTGDKGISFSLTGRSFGTAPPKPVYKSNAEGKVVVEINVDRNGNVTSARPGIQGTTTSDNTLHEAAREAALKTNFDSNPDAPAVQKGTITYIFILQ